MTATLQPFGSPGSGEAVQAALKCPIEADGVRRLLLQSWPFVFIDRILELEPGKHATGVKSVSQAEPYFAGHFPHKSIMPGVLIIEALAQLSGIVVTALHQTNPESREAAGAEGRGYLASVNRFRFRDIVRPGDQLRLRTERTGGAATLWDMRCEARVGPKVVADGRIVIAT